MISRITFSALVFFFFVNGAISQSIPNIRIQVLAIHSSKIAEIILSSEDGGDVYKTIRTPKNFDPLKNIVPELILSGSEFSKNVERFSLEIRFAEQTTISVPLRLLRPTKNSVKDVRVTGREVKSDKYAVAIDRALDIFAANKAYEPYSLCKSYFQHTKKHPSFQLSAAICWLKANRLMALATKPPYRDFFGVDRQVLDEIKAIIRLVENQESWSKALQASYYPNISIKELELDLKMLELSEWRLFDLEDITKLDKIYGKGHSCSTFNYFREKYDLLSGIEQELVLSDAIGVIPLHLQKLERPQLALSSTTDCSSNESNI